MNSTQTAQGDQKTASGTSPFDQITELEQRENARIEKEISAMRKEKEEVTQSVSVKEETAYEEMKAKAKQELKEYSNTELKAMLHTAEEEADAECSALKKAAATKEQEAVQELISIVKNSDSLFQNA